MLAKLSSKPNCPRKAAFIPSSTAPKVLRFASNSIIDQRCIDGVLSTGDTLFSTAGVPHKAKACRDSTVYGISGTAKLRSAVQPFKSAPLHCCLCFQFAVGTMASINIGGVAVPRLAFGLGSLMKWAPNHAYPLPTDSSKEVRQAIAAGFRHFNTGDLYTNNESAAEVLRSSGLQRHEIFLSLKLNTYAMLGCRGRDHMIENAKREIDRFGLDGFVDVLQLHFPPRGYSGQLSNREAWRVLEELKDQGIARIIGVSNW